LSLAHSQVHLELVFRNLVTRLEQFGDDDPSMGLLRFGSGLIARIEVGSEELPAAKVETLRSK